MFNTTRTDSWHIVPASLQADDYVANDVNNTQNRGEKRNGARRAEDFERKEGIEQTEYTEGARKAGEVAGGTVDKDILASYLQVLPEYRVVLCTTHGGCYIRQNLSRHLLEKHRLKSTQRRWIEADSRLRDIAATAHDVVQPPDETDEIQGLPTVFGYLCHIDQCNFRTASPDRMRQHYNQKHCWQVSRQGPMPWRRAHLQTLFTQSQAQHYFTVIPADQVRTLYQKKNTSTDVLIC
ncbi:hypothetical protein VTO42DRAFT_3796 [Malbranchea cinnamomea]